MSLEPDELTGTEQAVLLVLMTQVGRVPNPELAKLGPELKKPDRDRLHRHKLIDVFPGRPMELQLTEKGWDVCHKLLDTEPPQSVRGQGKVLYAVLGVIESYLTRKGLRLADLFEGSAGGGDEAADSPTPVDNVAIDDVETLVRQRYSQIAGQPGDWVGLGDLREALAEVPRNELDATLLRLNRSAGFDLAPEENQKSLTDADRAAAIVVGLKQNHLIRINS